MSNTRIVEHAREQQRPKAGTFRTVDFDRFLRTLRLSLINIEGAGGTPAALSYDGAAEPLELDLATAATLGLVIKEILANAGVHEFPHCPRTIHVFLVRHVASAGLTIWENAIVAHSTGSELRCLDLVSRQMRQVGGSAQLENRSRWILTFPVVDLLEGNWSRSV